MTRIVQWFDPNDRLWFIPQWQDQSTCWHEFIVYDTDSPYLHPKMCLSADEALAFLAGGTAIYNPGQHGCIVYKVSNSQPVKSNVDAGIHQADQDQV